LKVRKKHKNTEKDGTEEIKTKILSIVWLQAHSKSAKLMLLVTELPCNFSRN